ncbi:MAG: response regulator [Desulfobacteraceae bacterium]|nr:MAG: response regulator [Desulfobacteraceae bacterium]
MDKVLIVDSDIENLKKIENGFKELHHFKLLTATDGKTAIDILQQTKVTVVVTNISLPVIDGAELIAYMTRNHRATPCVIMLEPGKPKPWFTDRTGHEDILYYIEKPFEFGALASVIFVGLNLKDEGLTIKGMTLKNFLPVMALSRKTCQIEVVSGGQKNGFMYFKEGVLLDAESNGFTGDAAAKNMAAWDGVSLTISALPKKNHTQRIETKLMEIAGAIWRQKSKTPSSGSQIQPLRSPEQEKQSKLQESVSRCVSILRTIKGYMGLAVLNPGGDILAMDRAMETLDIKSFSTEFNDLFAKCSQSVTKKGLERCTGLTVHTPKAVIIMMTSDAYKEGNFRFIGFMAPEGNGYFMQTQLSKIIPQILASA